MQNSVFKSISILLIIGLGTFSSLNAFPLPESSLKEYAESVYESLTGDKPEFDIFYKGISGYLQLKDSKKITNQKETITLIDFRKSANDKRMWIIDLKSRKVLYHSLVAHGRNSGEVYAKKFSNTPNSNQSSLGFYVTGNTYIGKHGLSLILNGMEDGINNLAKSRAIVIHGAAYVSENYIKKVGRLGRSFGCPAIPMANYKEIIRELEGGTCLFIYYPDETYLTKSKLSKDELTEASISRLKSSY